MEESPGPGTRLFPIRYLSALFRGTAGYPLIRSMSHGDILRVEGLVKGHLTDETGNRKKLGAANRTEAVAIALRKQLLKV